MSNSASRTISREGRVLSLPPATPNNFPDSEFGSVETLLHPFFISINERNLPFNELPGIYGILLIGLRTTNLSGPPIFKAAFVPPI